MISCYHPGKLLKKEKEKGHKNQGSINASLYLSDEREKTCLNTNLNYSAFQGRAKDQNKTCFIMSIFNIMFPKWHPVPCKESLTVDVMCVNSQFYQNKSLEAWKPSISSDILETQKACILFQLLCYQFTKIPVSRNMKWNENVKVIMQAISSVTHTSHMFVAKISNKSNYFQFDSLTQKTKQTTIIPDQANMSLFVSQLTIERSHFRTNRSNHRIFECSDKSLVSIKVVFNEATCSSRAEKDKRLQCIYNGTTWTGIFCAQKCRSPLCTCSPLFYQTVQGGCKPYDRTLQNFEKYAESIQANKFSGLVLFTDCTPRELEISTTGKRRRPEYCSGPQELMCTFGCSSCFLVSNLCMFDVTSTGGMKHCPSGAHLMFCEEIECKNTFKCPKAYCIPYR